MGAFSSVFLRLRLPLCRILSGIRHNGIQSKLVFEVEYLDGFTKKITANIISDNMLSQVDSEGHHYQVLTEVTYHKINKSVTTNVNGFIDSINNKINHKQTTRSCKILVEQKYGSVDWVPLEDLKKSNPVELEEYEVENEISDDPVFSWWVKETLRCQDMII